MKNLNEFLLESIDMQIDEGFLQKLKDGIENFVDNSKEYIEEIHKKSKNDKNWGEEFIKGHREEFTKELDNLNNDEELKKIYKYFKKMGDEKRLYGGLGITNENTINKLLEKLMKDFNCEKPKALAIMNILYVYRTYEIESGNKKSKKSSSSYSSKSSSSNSSATMFGAAAGVALAMNLH